MNWHSLKFKGSFPQVLYQTRVWASSSYKIEQLYQLLDSQQPTLAIYSCSRKMYRKKKAQEKCFLVYMVLFGKGFEKYLLK
jgi:hypothetical protein